MLCPLLQSDVRCKPFARVRERKRRKVSVRQSKECAVTSACAKYKSHSGQDMKKACTSFPKECDAGSCPLRRVLTDTYRWQWLTSKLSVR